MASAPRGHSLCVAHAERPLVFCWRCGLWGETRLCGLASPCRGYRLRAGRDCLGRLARGLHPRRPEKLVVGVGFGPSDLD